MNEPESMSNNNKVRCDELFWFVDEEAMSRYNDVVLYRVI